MRLSRVICIQAELFWSEYLTFHYQDLLSVSLDRNNSNQPITMLSWWNHALIFAFEKCRQQQRTVSALLFVQVSFVQFDFGWRSMFRHTLYLTETLSCLASIQQPKHVQVSTLLTCEDPLDLWGNASLSSPLVAARGGLNQHKQKE